ncbi:MULTISPECIES: AEC family transporter [Clostridia]|uniref:AEC family transporter n=1 Tax=Clostridia TaxID=186801 RepID=UPI0012B39BBA|nr:AEC family transporter [Clostridium sp. WB02_MRS01]MBW4844636.1 AEC family transporter [Lachnospiraceae bacterium]MSS10491.1 AEC family transporter [Clostridium sp. WB02_MRS01]
MDYSRLLNLQGMLFLLVAAGVVLRKKGILPEGAKAILTDLVIYLILPCNIINSFFIEFNLEILKGFAVILTIASLIQIGCLMFAKVFYNREPESRKKVLQYGTVCSNAGFMGNPIAEGVYGAEGLMYASIFLIPQRIVMWSAGVSYFTESPDRKTVVKKVLTHPCIIAVYIGLALMITRLPLPAFLQNTIRSVGSCTTTVSMVLIGAILAEVEPGSILDWGIVKYAAIRLFLLPLLVYVSCRAFHVKPLLAGVSVLLTGMPAGSTTAILASKYDGDYIFATKCVVVTTLLSLVTIPLWCMVL